METPVAVSDEKRNENSTISSTDKPINRRRSSIFKRKSIVTDNQNFDSSDSTQEIKEIIHEAKKFKFHKKSDSNSFDIQKYVENLKQENHKWRQMYAKRKLCVQDLTKHYKRQEKTGQTLDIAFLSDSERSFLAAKVDYEEFNKNLFQLHTVARKVTFLNACAENYYKKSILKLQNNADTAVHRIINLTD